MKNEKSFVNWMRSSLVGHIVAGQLLYALPVFLILIGLHLEDGGTVSPGMILRGLIGVPVAGIVFGALFWFTVTAWARKK